MASSAWPDVRAALVALTDTALSVRVVNGFDLSADPGDVVMIGVPSLSDFDSISAGSFSQDVATLSANRTRDETGTVNGVVMARNGEGDQALATATAFGYIADLEDAIRTNRSLGLTQYQLCEAFFASGDVLEDQLDGATTAISFVISYRARI